MLLSTLCNILAKKIFFDAIGVLIHMVFDHEKGKRETYLCESKRRRGHPISILLSPKIAVKRSKLAKAIEWRRKILVKHHTSYILGPTITSKIIKTLRKVKRKAN